MRLDRQLARTIHILFDIRTLQTLKLSRRIAICPMVTDKFELIWRTVEELPSTSSFRSPYLGPRRVPMARSAMIK